MELIHSKEIIEKQLPGFGMVPLHGLLRSQDSSKIISGMWPHCNFIFYLDGFSLYLLLITLVFSAIGESILCPAQETTLTKIQISDP